MENEEINKLKQIPETGSFVANGVTYYIEEELSIDRWIKYQAIVMELGYDVEYEGVQMKLREAWDMLRQSDFANSAVCLYNLMNGIAKMHHRNPVILKFCALFFNTANEDRGMINDDQIGQKIEDWKKEGLGIDGFFVFALLKVKGLAENYKKASQKLTEAAQSE
jgi:hypothetical protein